MSWTMNCEEGEVRACMREQISGTVYGREEGARTCDLKPWICDEEFVSEYPSHQGSG